MGKKLNLSVYVEMDHYRVLLDLAHRRGVSMATIVREALDQYLKQIKEEDEK
jgi:predicted DNA-binding protein